MDNKKDTILDGNGTVNKKPSVARKFLPYVILTILLSLSVGARWFFNNLSVEKEQQKFEEYVDRTLKDITARLHSYSMILHGGVGVFIASEDVSREEWRAYVNYRQVPVLNPGSQGLGVSRVVRAQDLDSHIREVRAQGFLDYMVWPADERAVYVPVVFLEPFGEHNRHVLGYDSFSEQTRRWAMERARDTGQITISGMVELVQDQFRQPGFVMYAPIFHSGIPPDQVDERRAAIWGYVYAVFVVNDFMRGVFQDIQNKIDFKLYDGAEINPATLMYDSNGSSGSPGKKSRPMFTMRKTLDLFGHQWTLAFETTPFFEAQADTYTANVLLAGGIVMSLLIFLVLKLWETTGSRALSLAGKMTATLRKSEERHQMLNDNLPVGVSLIGPNMEILAANATKRRWFPESDPDKHPLCFTVYHTPPP